MSPTQAPSPLSSCLSNQEGTISHAMWLECFPQLPKIACVLPKDLVWVHLCLLHSIYFKAYQVHGFVESAGKLSH